MAKIKKLAETVAELEAGAGTNTPWTMSIPAAGKKYFGLGKFASYQAADEGVIPFIQVGRLKKALPRKIEQKLAGDDD
jgi:hypothetical protein